MISSTVTNPVTKDGYTCGFKDSLRENAVRGVWGVKVGPGSSNKLY